MLKYVKSQMLELIQNEFPVQENSIIAFKKSRILNISLYKLTYLGVSSLIH